MHKFQVAYLPIGVPTFHLESAQKEFERSAALLKKLCAETVCPDEMLLTMDKLTDFCDTLQDPSLVVIQNVTFANGAYAGEILRRFNCPVVLWTLREPVIDGGRLRLNSLTGAYSAANMLWAFSKTRFQYVLGSPGEEAVKRALTAALGAARVKDLLRGLKMVSVGHTPQGFGFGRALDADLLSVFGVTLDSIEARELIDKAKGYTDEECAAYLAEASGKMNGLDGTPDKNRLDFARLCKAYLDYAEENHVGALSSRCWPDFFTAFGTPVCGVLALLNDKLIPASCEADAYGALSMYIGAQLTGRPTFFGDPVSLDEDENTVTYWHCGTAACSLARPDTGAKVDVHCNRKIGPTLDFGCIACDKVTVFRVGRTWDGSFRFFVAGGEALDKPKQFNGCSVVVKTETSARALVEQSVKDGWEPHFAVVYGEVKAELKALADMLGLEVCEY
ncbi:MAG: fucose isomerase [Lawsonibacter sp.]